MSKRILLFLSVLISVFLFYSMGTEYCLYADAPHTFSNFLGQYINTSQKYLYNGMIYGLPVVYAFAVPFAQPEVRIRIKKSVFGYIFAKSVTVAIGLGLYVMGLAFGCAVYFGIPLDFKAEMLIMTIRLVAVYLQCHLLFYLVYTLCSNPVISIVAALGINLIYNIALLAYNFVFDPLNKDLLLPYDLYVLTSGIIACISLCCTLRRKEWLK